MKFTLIHLIMKERGLMIKFHIKCQTFFFDAIKINSETTRIILSAPVTERWVGDM